MTLLLFVGLLYILRGSGCPKYEPSQVQGHTSRPTIYAVTPTYARPVQKAELTRLSQTIMLVPNIFWVIVEDSDTTTPLVANILKSHNLQDRSVQINIKTPKDFKLTAKDPNWIKPRGVEQRNLALEFVRKKLAEHPTERSIVFFMDDDNSYSIQLFDEMAKIEPGRVGVWPVGLVGGLMVETPILDAKGVVTGFNAAWRPERQFPIDMAGFAISGDLLQQNPAAKFSYEVQRGYQETEILRQVTSVEKLQPLANMCTEVFVWHTRTEAPKLKAEEALQKAGKSSYEKMEV